MTILMLLLFINVYLVVIHLIPLIIITIVITSLFLLFLYQLEKHVTCLVCEVELNTNIRVFSYVYVLKNWPEVRPKVSVHFKSEVLR